MNFLTNYAARIFERASYSNNAPIVEYLSETMSQVSRDIHSVVGRPQQSSQIMANPQEQRPPVPSSLLQKASLSSFNNSLNSLKMNHNSQSLLRGDDNNNNQNPNDPNVNITPETQEMFQQFLTFLKLNKSNNNNDSNNKINTNSKNIDTNGNNSNNNIHSNNNGHFSS